MTNLAVELKPIVEPVDHKNVISFDYIKSIKDQEKNKPERKGGKVAGQDSEVYAFRTREEIAAMINVLDKHISESINDNQRKIAHRNKMMFLIGINIGIRASDLRTLKWSFFFDEQADGSLKFKKFYKIIPMKQRKQKKFVPMYFNQTVQQAINNYITEYPIENLEDYLFASRKGNDPISANSLYHIIKDIAIEAGIEQNIGSHSLRKTFGFWCWHEAKDKNKALVILQQIFNHSSTQVTAKYIGILDDEIEDMFNSIELGFDFI